MGCRFLIFCLGVYFGLVLDLGCMGGLLSFWLVVVVIVFVLR